jgi:transcriptional regulator with XRE-family HTH domain
MLAVAQKRKRQVDESHPVVRTLRWIIAERGLSERQLSASAGLTGVHVGQILGGFQSPEIQLETARKLAAAGSVPVSWFQDGPDVEPRTVELDRRYGSDQEIAEELLIKDGWPARQVLRASGEAGVSLQSAEHPTAADWHRRMLECLQAGKRAEQLGAAPPPVGRQPNMDDDADNPKPRLKR